MASDLERAYPYRTPWQTTGCGVFMFGLLGAGAAALIPIGWGQFQAGRMPIGVAMVVGGLFGTPMLLMAAASLIGGVRDSINPPLLRVTPAALLLPESLRATTQTDAEGEPNPDAGPPQPAEVPFAAIRRVRREGPLNPGSHTLVIVHDLARAALVVEQHMMRAGDFDELEALLRAAIPAAFAPAPKTGPAG